MQAGDGVEESLWEVVHLEVILLRQVEAGAPRAAYPCVALAVEADAGDTHGQPGVLLRVVARHPAVVHDEQSLAGGHPHTSVGSRGDVADGGVRQLRVVSQSAELAGRLVKAQQSAVEGADVVSIAVLVEHVDVQCLPRTGVVVLAGLCLLVDEPDAAIDGDEADVTVGQRAPGLDVA